jgi:uncharacterized protein (TIGR02118 family)
MIKLSVLYPNSEGAKFDIEYYCNSHMALVRKLLGEALKGIAVDEGISQEGSPAPFLAIGHLIFDSLKASESALNTHGATLMADIANYTNTKPAIQVSEIRM